MICCICFENCVAQARFCSTCSSAYHNECIQQWLLGGLGCPCCRSTCGEDVNNYYKRLHAISADDIFIFSHPANLGRGQSDDGTESRVPEGRDGPLSRSPDQQRPLNIHKDECLLLALANYMHIIKNIGDDAPSVSFTPTAYEA